MTRAILKPDNMRDWLVCTALAVVGVIVSLTAGDLIDALFIVLVWGAVTAGTLSLLHAGERARRAMREETRLHNRERPIGVTVDFDNSSTPVPCEVVADPEGDVDDNGNPLRWLARPLYIPEGAERIISYSVGIWPSQHAITLNIEGLEK